MTGGPVSSGGGTQPTRVPGRKMTMGELKALLAAERYDALSAMMASKLSDERATALHYYLGDMSKDMPAPEGRSQAVSTDIADTVEGLMPQLMEIFAGGDEVVRFDPVGPQDVIAAEQETDYVNHVFMQKNPGFLVLYSFIKDALLSKVGICKVWWEHREEVERETYLDLTEDQFSIIAGDPDVDIVEHTEHDGAEQDSQREQLNMPGLPTAVPATQPGPPGPPGAALMSRSAGVATPDHMAAPPIAALPGAPGASPPGATGAPAKLHDVTVETKRTYAQARVEGVTPEEFGISRRARNIKDTDYCFHDVFKTQSKLIELGYDEAQVRRLPSYTLAHTIEEIARDTVNESTLRQGDDGLNEAARLIRITEHYVRMDYDGEGRADIYRVTTAGEEGEVLIKDGDPAIVREDVIPFAAMTPFIITHRFFGRSIADLIVDIQRIKTALLRGMLDNLYLHNNPRVEVSEAHASETTLDDLLVSRPGGIVRTRQPGGLNWQEVPDITGSIYPALQYMDATREWRTGLSRQGQGVDPDALQNQVATIANQMFNATQSKVKLIARIFAETGIRDLFWLLHATIRKHGRNPDLVRLKNQWVTVNPRDWRTREDMSIAVGLGTGSKAEQLAHLQLIIAAQEKAVMGGLPIVSATNLYNSGKQIVKIAGFKNPDEFFTAPGQPPDPNNPASTPLQKPPDPKHAQMEQQMALAQQKAAQDQQAAQVKQQQDAAKVQQDAAHEHLRMQTELTIEHNRAEIDKQLAIFKAELDARKAEHQMQMAAHKQAADTQANQAQAQAPKAAIEIKHSADQLVGPISDVLTQHAKTMGDLIASHSAAANTRKRIKTPSGKVYEIESVQ